MSQLRETVIPVAVIVLVLGIGGYFHEPIEKHFRRAVSPAVMQQVHGEGSADQQALANVPPPPALHKDTVYRWVDAKGNVHFEQQGGKGREAVEVDQSRTQSLSGYKGPVGHAQ